MAAGGGGADSEIRPLSPPALLTNAGLTGDDGRTCVRHCTAQAGISLKDCELTDETAARAATKMEASIFAAEFC